MPIIQCTGRDGVIRDFDYTYQFDQLDQVWYVFVASIPRPPSNNTFDITLTPLNGTTLRQTSIANHGDQAYVAMGIPDAVLPAMKAALGMQIESSPPASAGQAGVFRSVSAEKMWHRLVQKGIALYDSNRQIYQLV